MTETEDISADDLGPGVVEHLAIEGPVSNAG